jgi:UDP-N-acetylmuramyl pentapeptide phosphotransferase/UDP-N-acetylglucosamine-1-phosphate transferase
VPGPTSWIAVASAMLGSAMLTRMAIVHARRRALLDMPGRRRMHRIPTARGGGIGIVLVACIALLWALFDGSLPRGPAGSLLAGLVLVAGIGWIDDHRPLSAGLRLMVHVVAAGLFVANLPAGEGPPPTIPVSAALFGLKVMLLVTAVNFWNFMDGIDGLVASQTAWVAACTAVLFALAGQSAWALFPALVAGACLGFLPFNFPRARVFLGDVGSGGAGFLCGAMLLVGDAIDAASPWVLAAIPSALLLDAGWTLATRILRGRRWYTAHREHLYQWQVRSGRTHASTTSRYLGWNLLFVLPILWLSRNEPGLAPMLVVALFASGSGVWWQGKRAALRRVRRGGRG